jgi:hypothetical protein
MVYQDFKGDCIKNKKNMWEKTTKKFVKERKNNKKKKQNRKITI